MTAQLAQYIAIGLLCFGWTFIFKLFWNELQEMKGLVKDVGEDTGSIKVDIAKIYERIEGQGAQIRELKKTKR